MEDKNTSTDAVVFLHSVIDVLIVAYQEAVCAKKEARESLLGLRKTHQALLDKYSETLTNPPAKEVPQKAKKTKELPQELVESLATLLGVPNGPANIVLKKCIAAVQRKIAYCLTLETQAGIDIELSQKHKKEIAELQEEVKRLNGELVRATERKKDEKSMEKAGKGILQALQKNS